MSIKKLVDFIKDNDNVVIAIEGPSGSGKSTLASTLEKDHDVLVFHTDDYFLHPSKKTEQRLNEPGGNLDYERMEEEIFKHLQDKAIVSHHFNCMTNELELREPFTKKSVIIVEGVYSMHPRFQQYYDYRVFIKIEEDKQKSRILERSGEFMLSRFLNEWIPLENKFFKHYNIINQVDLIIEN